MTSPKTQLKLGLLVICVFVALLAMAVGYGLHRGQPVVRYHTYFDESVAGLDVGSSVEFRGLHVGSVASIEVAPDLSRIDVAFDVAVSEADKLDLDKRSAAIRARLESSGITGVKYIDLEPAVPEAPLPPLAFVPDAHYIPARTSFLHSLQEHAERVAGRLPVLVDRVTSSVDKVGRLFDELEQQRIAERLEITVEHADAAMADLHHFVHDVDHEHVPEKASAVLGQLLGASTKLRGLVAKLEGDGELEQAIREIGGAARAFRELVREVEREPDMLVKGRARSGRL